MPGVPKHVFTLRLALATILALCVPWALGPNDASFRSYALSLAILTVLAALLRERTNEGGLIGHMATGGMALLMFTPAVGIRASRVSDAIFTANHIAPHEAMFQLPAIAQTVPDASGPLLLGAGLALLTVCGRLGATYAGIALGGAAGAWAGHNFAVEAGVSMHAERFAEAVLYAQSMRFVGFTVLIGALIGHIFARQGQKAWREASHRLLLKQRTDEANRIRQEELDRMASAKSALDARVGAEEARKVKESEEGMQGVTVEGIDDPKTQVTDEDAGAADENIEGMGGGFSEEDGEPEDDESDDAGQEKSADGEDGEGKVEEEETFEEEVARLKQELLPRFDVETPIVVDIEPEETDPDHHLDVAAATRYRRIISGLVVIACMTAGWTTTPSWFSVLNALPDPGTEIAVPHSEPGLSITRTPMNPFHKNFAQQLEDRGHGRLYGALWPCMSDTYNGGDEYGSQGRGVESLAIPADTKVIDLYPSIIEMRRRGVYRMGLTGRAEPPYGPLGSLFAWPAVQLLLDRPPRTIQWIALHSRHLEKLPLLPGRRMPKSCAILVDDEVTVDGLYSTTRSLSSIYGDRTCRNGIALVFPEDGTTTNTNPAWRGCP